MISIENDIEKNSKNSVVNSSTLFPSLLESLFTKSINDFVYRLLILFKIILCSTEATNLLV